MNNKENLPGQEVFKTPSRQDTIRRPRDVKNGTQIKRTPTVLKAKPILSTSSIKTTKDDISKDIDNIVDKLRSNVTLADVAQLYFCNSNNGKKAIKASNKTMTSLGSHRLTPEQATILLGKLDSQYCAAEIELRFEQIKYLIFPRVVIQLHSGFNILLYGVGSKKRVLEDFHKLYLLSENSIVVPGFSADVNIQTVLNRIIECYMSDLKLVSRSVQGMAEAVRDYFRGRVTDKLYLVIHNIDGPQLRNSANIFSILTQSDGIQIIATVDHIHSGMMFDQGKVDYVWHDCTTMCQYSVETRVDNARLMSDKNNRGMTLSTVIDSLNSQARTVFLHLAKYQLSHHGHNYDGMSLDSLYTVCKDNLLVNTELSLRTHLTEFRDHKLVYIKHGIDRSEYIKILLDSTSLKDFVENFQE